MKTICVDHSDGEAVRKIELTRGYVALVDQEDFDLVSQYKWYAHLTSNWAQVYAESWASKRRLSMHRLITGAAKGEQVDHRNGNGIDNRRSNLRLCSLSQNGGNSRLSRNNTSGFKGVSFDKRRNCWKAEICFEGKRIHLGSFSSSRHAALAYNAAARRYFGAFARVNSFPITGATKGNEVNHSNGNGIDNRRARLRCDNTSGFKVVSFKKVENCWRARIQFEGKEIHLGYFDSPRRAALAYNGAARKFFGKFAKVNSFPIMRQT